MAASKVLGEETIAATAARERLQAQGQQRGSGGESWSLTLMGIWMMGYEIWLGRMDVFLDEDTRSWTGAEMVRKRCRAVRELEDHMWCTGTVGKYWNNPAGDYTISPPTSRQQKPSKPHDRIQHSIPHLPPNRPSFPPNQKPYLKSSTTSHFSSISPVNYTSILQPTPTSLLQPPYLPIIKPHYLAIPLDSTSPSPTITSQTSPYSPFLSLHTLPIFAL